MAMTLVSTTTLGSSASSITFSSIPATGKDLLFLINVRDTGSTADRNLLWRLNGASANFQFRVLYGDGLGTTGSQNNITLGVSSVITTNPAEIIPGTSSTADAFSNAMLYLPNYTSANFKGMSFDGVGGQMASTYTAVMQARWENTAAVTSVTFEADGSFATNSSISLYIIS